ncbi:MAG: hypothetical protein JO337_12295 [Acidimicrobiales bacterium]|nr:hypothetical protein [Acidimicrobiales bacterium]
MATAQLRTSRWVPSRWVPGPEGDERVYFGAVRPAEQDPGEPQAFIVRLPPGHEGLRVHFHPVDQFQVFVSGSGTFGQHQIRSGLAHYSDALTPYGPLRLGPDGASFMTLRHQADFDIQHMPDKAAQLAELRSRSPRSGPAKRRNLTADLCAQGPPGTWMQTMADDDGLRIATRALGPGEPVPPLSVTAPGAYVLLVAGALKAARETLGPGALAWLTPDLYQLAPASAGPDGADLALLQFPSLPSDLETSRAFLAERARSA